MINNALIPVDIITKIICYLPNDNTVRFRVACVSRSFRQASYANLVWYERLARTAWQYDFFLPPAGAGGVIETLSRVYTHFNPSRPHDAFPEYAYRQLVLANVYRNLADRHPHLAPGVAILNARRRGEGWMVQRLPQSIYWDMVVHLVAIYSFAAFIGVTTKFVIDHAVDFLNNRTEVQVITQSISNRILEGAGAVYNVVEQVFPVSSLLDIISAIGETSSLWLFGRNLSQMRLSDGVIITSACLVHKRFYRLIVQREFSLNIGGIINGLLPGMVGSVASVVTLVQLVAQRAFQTGICKIRVMVHRYWP